MLLAPYSVIFSSLHTFVKDSEYDLVGMVDDLLSTLTHGTHKRAIQSIEEKRNQVKSHYSKNDTSAINAFTPA